MPTRVLLMRHAETCNPGVFHGFESDADLTEFGYAQAAAAAPGIAAQKPDVVYSSAMLRARMTATPIAQACHLPLYIEPELHERKVEILVGTQVNPEIGIFPETLQRWIAGDTAYATEGTESYDAMQRRVLDAWDRVTTAHEGKSIVVVAPWERMPGIIAVVASNRSVADWTSFGRMANCSISELIGSGRSWQAIRIAEVPPEMRPLKKPG